MGLLRPELHLAGRARQPARHGPPLPRARLPAPSCTARFPAPPRPGRHHGPPRAAGPALARPAEEPGLVPRLLAVLPRALRGRRHGRARGARPRAPRRRASAPGAPRGRPAPPRPHALRGCVPRLLPPPPPPRPGADHGAAEARGARAPAGSGLHLPQPARDERDLREIHVPLAEPGRGVLREPAALLHPGPGRGEGQRPPLRRLPAAAEPAAVGTP